MYFTERAKMTDVQILNNENNLHIYHARNYDSAGVVEFNGGTTLAFYVQPSGRNTVVMYGLARCHENDGFDRKVGRDLAIIRLSQAPTTLITDFPTKFLVCKEFEVELENDTDNDTDIDTDNEAIAKNYRLPSSRMILTMFVNCILEHFAQEMQDKAFRMYDSALYADVDDLKAGSEVIMDAEHANAVVHGSKNFVPSLGNGASEHDALS